MRGEMKGSLWEGRRKRLVLNYVKRKEIEYSREELVKAMELVDYYEQKIKEEEEKRTQKYIVRVIVDTEEKDGFCRSTTISELYLTLEQRERVIANLAWLRKVGNET